MINRIIIEKGRKEFRDETLEIEKGISPDALKGHGLVAETALRAKSRFGAYRLKLVAACITKDDMKNLTGEVKQEMEASL